eukprot:3275988-Rhodomonas_salina.1
MRIPKKSQVVGEQVMSGTGLAYAASDTAMATEIGYGGDTVCSTERGYGGTRCAVLREGLLSHGVQY